MNLGLVLAHHIPFDVICGARPFPYLLQCFSRGLVTKAPAAHVTKTNNAISVVFRV